MEKFEGFVDRIMDGTAFVTLKSEHGEELHGEYPADKLLALGIFEHRRFRCETVVSQIHGDVEILFEAIPDLEVDEDAISQRIDELGE